MKKLLVNLAICSTLPLCAATAFGAGSNYASLNIGPTFLSDADLTHPTGAGEGEFDNGWGIGAAVGHDYGTLRAELELAYRTNDFDRINQSSPVVGTANADGDMTSLALMVNGYYDFKNSSSVTPYLMGGLGFARIDMNDVTAPGVLTGIIDGDDTVFAYQLGGGVGFKATDALTLDLAYRFFATSDPEFEGGWKSEYFTHNITVGARLAF